MSQHLIQQYLNQLSDLRRVSGTGRESVVREAFKDLLKGWGRSLDLYFVPEYGIVTAAKRQIYVDGALLHELRVPFGYWEAKDENDDLDEEIARKFRKGYPQDNILFEDSRTAVLIQNRQEVMRCPVDDTDRLKQLLDLFFGYERAEIAEFRKAVEQFKTDLPAVLEALRGMIEESYADNPDFRRAARQFLDHARDSINPSVGEADVREMLIQHILTEEIFAKVFGEDDFHRQNNIARQLYGLEATFFTGNVKKRTLKSLEPYYAAIRAAAAQISGHNEKQTFLKVIYENFYKVYNRKAADRLGVVYTPNEIVRFMIEGTDWLCQKHFGRRLIDRDVEILDPAAGTGTFVTELIEHFRGEPDKLRHKYREELHANEVAILPYYVANLNIEATYAAITGEYEEFRNLCFVDTLDNIAGLRVAKGRQDDLFGAVSAENVERIKRQNSRKISVVIGNPPYNANQQNENDNNKNRTYDAIDQRIRSTYIAASTAQKTKLYDMYVRFLRWASDRVEANGIVAFVTNRNFIESRMADGLRKVLAEDFSEIYVVDLGGDVRADPRLSGTKHNVFGIQAGVAISFLVKREKAKGCRIFYTRRPQLETAEEKLAYLSNQMASSSRFQEISSNKNSQWLNIPENDFGDLISVANKDTKFIQINSQERAIFKIYSLGIATNRDDWVYDSRADILAQKISIFISTYNQDVERWKEKKSSPATGDFVDRSIKWTSELENYMKRGIHIEFSPNHIRKSQYRPFCSKYVYYDRVVIHRLYRQADIYNLTEDTKNMSIIFTDPTGMKPWLVSSSDRISDLHYVGAAAGSMNLPRHINARDQQIDNITDWALDQFQTHYAAAGKALKQPITKDAIFTYVYAVLHDPVYRETYAENLKKEFPRIPFYPDFWRWAAWGQRLLDLHIGYETVDPWGLTRTDLPDDRSRKAGLSPKPILRSDKEGGILVLDSETQLFGVPAPAWRYVLGNRCALDWVLDQHKEKTPKDPTVREKFNTYRFADHKERVIDLLDRVTRVSVETMEIVDAMKALPRD